MATKDTWNTERRALWNETWKLPHMLEGLSELKERMRVKPFGELPAGHDALVLAALFGANHVGRSEVFEEIERMRAPLRETKPLPEPFTREARGEKPPEPEK